MIPGRVITILVIACILAIAADLWLVYRLFTEVFQWV